MATDNKKEWFAKAQVDYYSAFITLWLSCNSWYNFHYSLNNDRQHIDKVKSDFTNLNKLYKEFEKIFDGTNPKEQKSLFSNLELLHYSLNRKNHQAPKLIRPLTFESVLVDYSKKDDINEYLNIVISNAKTSTGKLKSSVEGIDLGDIVLINNTEKVFSGLVEIIYQVRCLLVHGDLEPDEDNHEIVKYCYLIMIDLMKGFCK